ncbi:polyprenol monophosphomannose synthase [Dermabacter sp. p3-SID358]|uniref:polyprenol monophosphomannose synthase n=1 Tax=Dermabacter sp. p3-SID358 TaxID=2916114 RepID=UPI0021A49C11|nr:polyprenol monophosphomannose synthase [Dermabacter sp. p3-SID358]MCT1866066.1 polyprenol monophosphomannose synthase [Dermabacter sp. p3-SID358]
MTTLVIIPTYNEIDALPPTLERLRNAEPGAHVLVVDDGSPDGTGEWADKVAKNDAHVHVLHRTEKGGLGPAYLAGFAWGLEEGYDVLCEMDADSSHRPEQLGRLLTAIERGADLAIGSRWVKGGAVHHWPLNRELLSRGANSYVNIALGLGVKDATAGFRAFRSDVLTHVLAGEAVASQGYCFQVDMTRRVRAEGFVIREVPIDFDEREHGESKMSSAIIREAMVRVTQWGLEHRLAQARNLAKAGVR